MLKLIEKYRNMSDSIKASFWFMICNLLQKGIAFITVPIFTRLLSTDEYGFYSIFNSWESILSIFVTLNLSYQVFNNGMVKYKNDKDGYASSMIGLTFLSSTIGLIIYFIFSKIWYNFTGINFVYMLLMFTDMIFVGILGIWTVRQRYDFKYKLLVCITIFTMLANPILGIIFVIKFKEKILGRLLAMVIINVLAGLIAMVVLIVKGHKLISLEYWKYSLKIDLPLIPHYLAMVLLNNSDRIMIGEICGNSFAAFYSIAYNVAMIMQILINSINSSFNPWIYQKLQIKDYKEIKKVSSFLIVFIGIVCILPMFFGPEVILIFGSKEYSSASYVMSVISASVFMIYIYSLFINIELFYEKSKMVMYGSIGATIVNIILNYIFINLFGYIAAGYTTLISYILLAVFHYISVKKIMKENHIETLFFNELIFVTSIIVIVFSIIIQLLYNAVIVRYIVLLICFIIILFNISKVKKVFAQLKA